MRDKRKPYLEQWKDDFKRTLTGNRELSISEIAERLETRPETVSRWVAILELDGFLKTRVNGLKRMVKICRG